MDQPQQPQQSQRFPPIRPPESLGRVEDKKQARPETRFERRRTFWIVVLSTFTIAMFAFLFEKCSKPTSGVERLVGAPTPATKVAQMVQPQQQQVVVVPTPTPQRGWQCWALQDISVAGKLYPAQSLVPVLGRSRALGGVLILEQNTVVPLSYAVCQGELPEIAVVFTATPTPAISPTRAQVVVRYATVPVTVIVPATPAAVQVSSQYGGNGITLTDRCLHAHIYGITGIWIDGKPATGSGVYCDWSEVRITRYNGSTR